MTLSLFLRSGRLRFESEPISDAKIRGEYWTFNLVQKQNHFRIEMAQISGEWERNKNLSFSEVNALCLWIEETRIESTAQFGRGTAGNGTIR